MCVCVYVFGEHLWMWVVVGDGLTAVVGKHMASAFAVADTSANKAGAVHLVMGLHMRSVSSEGGTAWNSNLSRHTVHGLHTASDVLVPGTCS